MADQVVKKKGFRKSKKPTKAQAQNSLVGELKKAVENVSKISLQNMQSVRRLNDEVGVLSNLLRFTPSKEVAELGDHVMVDFLGKLEETGQIFQGGRGIGFVFELGKSNLVDGFEQNLLGETAGCIKDIDVVFPEQYTPELAGKKASFKVSLVRVYKSVENRNVIEELHEQEIKKQLEAQKAKLTEAGAEESEQGSAN